MYTKREDSQYFHEYFAEWVEIYKRDAVRPITYRKYLLTLKRLIELAPTLKLCELDKRSYQLLLNSYALTHEKQTTMDFHHHLKCAVMDAIDEGLLKTNPTRKVIIKGKVPATKKTQFLNQSELQRLLEALTLDNRPSWDWFILLVAKTGLRFSEALALTPQDFDFEQHKIKIIKTWNYKNARGGFADTKNLSSKRTLHIDPKLSEQLAVLTKGLAENEPVFIDGRVFNSTVNTHLKTLCEQAGVPAISVHCLRHTHASLLIFAGVSIASIAKRLGHSSVTTTQETYLHIIRELENQDNEKIMLYLAELI